MVHSPNAVESDESLPNSLVNIGESGRYLQNCLANVGESGGYLPNCFANVGEFGESKGKPKKPILANASTRQI
jgi:hypothetical protein